MNLTKKQIDLVSSKASKLVNDVEAEYRQTAFSVVFSLLLSNQPPEKKELSEKSQKEEITKIKSNKKGPKFYLLELVNDDFFKKPKSLSDMLQELTKRNHIYKLADLTRPLESLVHEKILRRDKIKINNKKQVWHYFNW